MMNLKKYFLLLLVTISILVLSCTDSSIKKSEINFAVNDTASISKIIIKDSINTISLEKSDNNWIINGQYIANKAMINRTLNTLMLIELKSPLPKNAITSISKKIKNQTHIEVFSDNEIIKSFYLGNYNLNSGNIIMLKDAEFPYIAYIPTFDFDLRENFSSETKQWMSKVIFHYKSSEIKEILLVNNKYEEQFFIRVEDDNYILQKNRNSEPFENINIDNIEFYLTHFENITFLIFFNNNQLVLDSISQETPVFEINIVCFDGRTIDFKGYELFVDNIKNENIFVGMIDEKNLILAKYYDFDLLMKNYSYFLN